jgi:hypothetical protein
MVLQTARKVAVLVIGGTVLLAGAVMLVTPGPGIAGILGGLAILATEFVWARVLLKRLKQRATALISPGAAPAPSDLQPADAAATPGAGPTNGPSEPIAAARARPPAA